MTQQRTLTVVITDMKGFTSRTSHQSRADTVELVTELRELLVPLLTAHGGQLIKSAGDGFLLTFESPTNAVIAGLALQDLLQRRNVNYPEKAPIEVRVAINTGEVAVQEGDVIGDAVNITARLQEQIEAGAVVLTESTYLSMNTAECVTRPMGTKTFRGAARPIKLFQAVSPSAMTVRRPGRKRWLAIGAVGCVAVWWIVSALRPAPAPTAPPADPLLETAVETPAEPVPEPVADAPTETPVETPPAEPDAELIATIQQTVNGFQDSLDSLALELRQASDDLFDWSRQLYNLESRATRLSGALTEVTRALPQLRDRHTSTVQRMIDRANENEDRGTADALWRELGQFEASLAPMESGAHSWLPSVDAANAALRAWDAPISEWSRQLNVLRQERSDRLMQVAGLRTLTTWEPQLDTLSTEVPGLVARVAELRQGMLGLRGELDGQQPTLDAAEEFLKSWEDFRDQWRSYLISR